MAVCLTREDHAPLPEEQVLGAQRSWRTAYVALEESTQRAPRSSDRGVGKVEKRLEVPTRLSISLPGSTGLVKKGFGFTFRGSAYASPDGRRVFWFVTHAMKVRWVN